MHLTQEAPRALPGAGRKNENVRSVPQELVYQGTIVAHGATMVSPQLAAGAHQPMAVTAPSALEGDMHILAFFSWPGQLVVPATRQPFSLQRWRLSNVSAPSYWQ